MVQDDFLVATDEAHGIGGPKILAPGHPRIFFLPKKIPRVMPLEIQQIDRPKMMVALEGTCICYMYIYIQ